MKLLIPLLLLIFSCNVNYISIKNTNTSISIGKKLKKVSLYKLHSKVWLQDSDHIQPIDGTTYFRWDKLDSVNLKLDTTKVRTLLIESFNEFREGYCVPPVIENKQLTSESSDYAKKISVVYKHDDIKRGCECIAKLPILLFANIKPSYGDFNKLVSECVFDVFRASKPHMDILTSREYTEWGFGIYLKDNTLHIVIRGI